MRLAVAVLSIFFASSVALNVQLSRRETIRETIKVEPSHLDSILARRLLKTVVKIKNTRHGSTLGTGSGVVLFSAPYGNQYRTYIVTNHHVVRGAEQVMVENFSYRGGRDIIGSADYQTKVLDSDPGADLALLEITTNGNIFEVAEFATTAQIEKLQLYERVYAIGCGYGEPPFVTNGNIASFDTHDGLYHLTSPIIMGNSGGAAYTQDGKLMAICTQIVAAMGPNNIPYPVTHGGQFIPIERVKKWLMNGGYEFIVRNSQPLFMIKMAKSTRRP